MIVLYHYFNFAIVPENVLENIFFSAWEKISSYNAQQTNTCLRSPIEKQEKCVTYDQS